MSIEFKIRSNMTDEFNMKFEGLAFFFEEGDRFVNPFFHKDEHKRRIAQIIFKENDELILRPYRNMTFSSGNITVEVVMLD